MPRSLRQISLLQRARPIVFRCGTMCRMRCVRGFAAPSANLPVQRAVFVRKKRERGRSVQLRQAQGTPGSRGIPNRTELLCMDDERRLPSLHEKSHHRDSPARTQQQRVRPSATEGNPILPYANAPAAGVFLSAGRGRYTAVHPVRPLIPNFLWRREFHTGKPETRRVRWLVQESR